jgi:hypothetical protein
MHAFARARSRRRRGTLVAQVERVKNVMMCVVSVAAIVSVGLLSGCDNDCAPGQRAAQVEGPLGPKNEWVCVADPSYRPVQSQQGTLAGGGNDAGADAASGSAVFGCEIADAFSADIAMTTASVEPPIVDAMPPDGTYDLGDAISYSGVTLPTMRARVRVAGSSLVLGVQTRTPAVEPVESFTLAFANGTLTTVCEVAPGTAAALFAPPAGTEGAHLAWDVKSGRLVLRLRTATGDFDLIFMPFL